MCCLPPAIMPPPILCRRPITVSSRLLQCLSLCCCAAVLWPVATAALSESQRERIAERLAPVGALCIEGEACAADIVVAPSVPRDGAEIYRMYCTACHDTGIGGAPRISERADWPARLAQGDELIYQHALQGLNAMPARGACPNCTDGEIRAAVDYMLDSLPAR